MPSTSTPATPDFIAPGDGVATFTLDNGRIVEIGRSTHRPGYGVTYGTYTYGR